MSGFTRRWVMTSILILVLIQAGTSQETLEKDISFLKSQLDQSHAKAEYFTEIEETNEIKMGVQLFFLLYKDFMSSQDNRNCSFSPSCSTYCLHAVRKRGVTKGILSAFDRLSRCNYLSPENYLIEPSSGRLLDPVE